MSILNSISEENADSKVKAIYDEIKKTRGINYVPNFWKTIANDYNTLERTWNSLQQVMQEGELSNIFKEMIYIAVSMTNGCEYCIHSHTATARKKGMTEEMRGELLSVISMASQTNALANSYQIEVDESFKK